MAQRTVLKVIIPCEKCKKKLLKSVSSLQGVDKIEVDEAKGTLTVTGEVDPYKVILKARKARMHVEVVTIGPPPQPTKKPDDKKPDPKKPEPKTPEDKAQLPYPCPNYPMGEIAFVQLGPYYEPGPLCAIM